MLTRNRLYQRKEPDKDATLFLIFCEGTNTEPRYFRYFNEINSRVRIIPIPADPQGNNSPTGLYENAVNILIPIDDTIVPNYDITDGDQVWFVVDTDQWKEQLIKLRLQCSSHTNWYIAQSNPCFEVWLCFHLFSSIPDFGDMHDSTKWKENLNIIIPGGFDHRKHPIYIANAIENAKSNFLNSEGGRIPPCTDVFKLAELFFPLVRDEIDKALNL